MEKGFMRTFLTFIKWIIIKLNSWPNKYIRLFFEGTFISICTKLLSNIKHDCLCRHSQRVSFPLQKIGWISFFKGGENLIFQIYEVSARVKMFFNNNTFLTFVKEIYSSFLFSLSFLYFWTNLVLIRSLILI